MYTRGTIHRKADAISSSQNILLLLLFKISTDWVFTLLTGSECFFQSKRINHTERQPKNLGFNFLFEEPVVVHGPVHCS
jgi:hypothetical protein